jgi:hypothetical protein
MRPAIMSACEFWRHSVVSTATRGTGRSSA